MERDGLDAVIVAGTEYTGFEGAVTYISGFVIVHRYAYVLLPREGDPAIVFPREARYVGEHGTTWIDEQVFVDRPGDWLADRVRGKRVGVYGLDYAMTVRDYRALAPAAELVDWDVAVRPRPRRQERLRARLGPRQRPHQHRGLLGLPRGLRAGPHRAARSSRRARSTSSREGCGRQTMDMVLVGENGAALPEFKIAGARRDRRRPTWCCPRSRSRARAATGSRSRARSAPASRATRRSGCSRPTTSTSTRRAARSATARPRTTSTAPSRRASSTAASSSATSPATRSG